MIDIQQQFDELPKEIRAWLSSERITNLVSGINDGLNLTKEASRRTIPRMILRLATQDIAPQDFINELSTEFDISRSSARVIAEEIDKRILQPIEKQLFTDVGVDTKLIFLKSSDFFSQPKTAIAEEIGSEEIEEKDGPKVITEETRSKGQESRPEETKITKQGAPRILHKEEQLKPLSSYRSITLEKGEQETSSSQKESRPPVSANVQFGQQSSSENTRQGEQKRVVHYGGYRTMLSPTPSHGRGEALDLQKGFASGDTEKKEATINLQTFQHVEKKEPEKPRFPGRPKVGDPRGKVRMGGNLVDLRNEES